MNKTQCKMARAALGWRAMDLAIKSDLSYPTIARFESGNDIAKTSLKAIKEAFEARGVQFLDEGVHVGVTVTNCD